MSNKKQNKFWLLMVVASALLAAIIIGRVPDIRESKFLKAGEAGKQLPKGVTRRDIAGSPTHLRVDLEMHKKMLDDLELLLRIYKAQNKIERIEFTQRRIELVKVKIRAVEARLMELNPVERLLGLLEKSEDERNKAIEGLKVERDKLKKELEGSFVAFRGTRQLAFDLLNDKIIPSLEKAKRMSEELKGKLEKSKKGNICNLTAQGKNDIKESLESIKTLIEKVREGVVELLENKLIKAVMGDYLLEMKVNLDGKVKEIESFIRSLE